MFQLKYSNPSTLQPFKADALVCVCVTATTPGQWRERAKGCEGEGGEKERERGGVGAFPWEPAGQRTVSWHPHSCINLNLI